MAPETLRIGSKRARESVSVQRAVDRGVEAAGEAVAVGVDAVAVALRAAAGEERPLRGIKVAEAAAVADAGATLAAVTPLQEMALARSAAAAREKGSGTPAGAA
jgi:hypothetical protein